MNKLTQTELNILSIKGMLEVAEENLNATHHSPLSGSRYDGEVDALKRVLRVLEPVTTYSKDGMSASVPLVESYAKMDSEDKL